MPQLLLLELNEINFEHLHVYASSGKMPTLSRLINEHGIAETTSESRYEELEPWIQWVTAHAGLTLSEHGVFRLGDILKQDIPQIWEVLEFQGLQVGAVSPMNAKNRCRNAAFFVPDPWTAAEVTARPLLKKLYQAVAQAVNDNAQARLTAQSVAWLLAGAAAYARPTNYASYAKMIGAARAKPWSKGMFLDLLLGDVFICETARAKPDFASMFLNAGAHIQHHYLFNSAAYRGKQENPEWYASKDDDPVFEVYQLYDRLVGQIQQAFPEARLIIATALHQDPCEEVTFYWRLKDHAAFLKKLHVPFERVEPRMSRDFLVVCSGEADAEEAEHILTSTESEEGVPLFEVDNRGTDLFVMLTYPHDIDADFLYAVRSERFEGLRNDVAFIAIKNGQHNGIGYFIDTGCKPGELPEHFPLKEIPARICNALGLEWKPVAGQSATTRGGSSRFCAEATQQ
jgi:hypothetical protein